MFCPEAPEVLFQDFGTGKLEGGFAHINLDPIFSKNITVNEKHPLRIFIQLEGECNGVYVTNKTATSFDVKELQNGNSSVAFTWFVTANRSNEVNPETGEVESAHVDARFPEGLGPQETKIRDVGSEQEQGYIEIKKIKNNK
jgi:hypothetical protein